ncbi:MAG: IS4 family transposase [Chloroflexota bacterium]
MDQVEIIETAEYNGDWTRDELSSVSLGDKRLDWRLQDSARKLASRPSVSINQACDDWADTKATYRLFANPKTEAEKILLPHQERTKARMAKYERCLVLQDTSYVDYSHHPSKKGMGPIGTTKQTLSGMVMHSALATTLDGLPLGTLSQQIWSRDEVPNQLRPEERRKLPIEEKESYKWLTALNQSVEHKPADTQLITVGDSEADIFEFFNHARQLETDLLIRAGQNRTVCEPEVGRLWSVLEKEPIAGHLAVHVSKRSNQPARDATVAVRYMSLSLKPPQHLRATMGPMPLYGILVQEVEPPTDVEPLCWLLLTTVPVCTFDDAVERIGWYCHRWQIEILHKILKSGCHIEDAQLDSDTRLKPMIALYTIIAWRLFWLTFLTRTDPDAPALTMLAPHELQALYWFHHKRPLPDSECPTVQLATRWIAQLGGFLNRKGDGEPGVTVIWRGWQRLNDISDAFLTFQTPSTYG